MSTKNTCRHVHLEEDGGKGQNGKGGKGVRWGGKQNGIVNSHKR